MNFLTSFYIIVILVFNRYTHFPVNPNDPPLDAQPKPSYPYRTIGCIFNNAALYANSQVSLYLCMKCIEAKSIVVDNTY